MSYTRKIIQQRPNLDVDFYTPSQDVVDVLDQYKTDGKIINFDLNIESDNKLGKTMIIEFDNEVSFDEFMTETLIIESAEKRLEYCSQNLISTSLEG